MGLSPFFVISLEADIVNVITTLETRRAQESFG